MTTRISRHAFAWLFVFSSLIAFGALASRASAVTLSDYAYAFDPDPTRFEAELATLTSSDATNPPPRNAIVGIGSSSMRMWAPRIHRDLDGLTVIPRGFGGSHFSDAIYYADELVLKYQPRAVIVYEGDNDTNNGKTAQRVRDDLEFFVDYCRTSLPDLRFYVLSVKPAPSRIGIWESTVVPANEAMEAYCEATEGVTYIDVSAGMFNRFGDLRNDIFLSDGIHLNDDGYDIWSAAIAPVLLAAEAEYESTITCEECVPVEVGDRVLIDFGPATRPTGPVDGEGAHWNNLHSFEAGASSGELVSASGELLPITLTILEGFESSNTAGMENSTVVPASASVDSFWTGSGSGREEAVKNRAVLRLNRLPAGVRFRLSLLPSRSGTDGAMDRLGRYQVGGQSIDLDASNNANTFAVFEGLEAEANGSIEIQIAVSPEGNGRFAYLNALVLEVIGPTWAEFPIETEFLVDTGSWLGYLYVGKAPWVYAYSLANWIYLPETAVGARGAWTYVPNLE